MEISIQIEGTEDLAANLRELDRDVHDKYLIQALQAGGQVIRDNAQAIAPVGKTGSLATSITVQTKGNVVMVGPNKDKRNDPGDKRHMRNDSIGIFQERGTKNHYTWTGQQISAAEARRKKKNVISFQHTEERMPARPFLGPAFQQSAQAVLQAEADKLRQLIEARKMKGI